MHNKQNAFEANRKKRNGAQREARSVESIYRYDSGWVVGDLTQEGTASGICMTRRTVVKRKLRWRNKFKQKQTPAAKNACFGRLK
jgi:hypothetical protein